MPCSELPVSEQSPAQVRTSSCSQLAKYGRNRGAHGLQFALAEEVSVGSDLKYAWRSIWKSPATTIGAMLALALGLGATTMIFGLFNAVLLRPLPYPHAERLVEIFGTVQREQTERRGTSFPDFFDWRDRSKSYDGMAAWMVVWLHHLRRRATRVGEGRDYRRAILRAARSPSGRRPHVPRLRSSARRDRQSPSSASVSGRNGSTVRPRQSAERCSSTLASSPSLVSRRRRFRGRSDQAVVWTPVRTSFRAGRAESARESHRFPALARLKEGVSLESAQAEMSRDQRAARTRVLLDQREALGGSVSTRQRSVSKREAGSVAAARRRGIRAVDRLCQCRQPVAGPRRITAARNVAATRHRRRRRSARSPAPARKRDAGRARRRAGLLLAQWTSAALLALSPVQLPSFAAPAVDWRTVAFVAVDWRRSPRWASA